MSHDKIPEPVLVTAREHLEEVASDLRAAPRLALDIESNGFYAYREKVCLLQVSSPSQDYIIDPIAVSDLSTLAPLCADPAIEKVFHAGEYDVLCLKRDYGFSFANVFDTMIASRVLGFKELGLAAAIERHFAVKLSKKLQRADWGKRPLTREQIRYAQLDTHYLMRLADIQHAMLKEKGRLEDAAEAFADLAAIEPNPKSFDPEGFWRLAAREKLSGAQTACLKEVYLFREEQAQSRDRAPFRVMPEDLMVRIARAMPQSIPDLERVRGMSPYLLQRYGQALMKAVSRGRESQPLEEAPRPARPRMDRREWRLFEELRQWRKKQAEEEGVEPVVILSSDTLREIARLAVENGGDPLRKLSGLKLRRYGAELHRLLKGKAGAP